MFESMQAAPKDKILALMAQYREDPRTEKVDLGVGVYKDENGNTTVMRAIRAAEKKLHEIQDTKTYVGLQGDKEFCEEMGRLVLGDAVPADRLRVCQAPGGSGALSILAMMLHRAHPDATLWLSDPSWAEPHSAADDSWSQDLDLPLLRSSFRPHSIRRDDGGAVRSQLKATSCCCTAAATIRRGPISVRNSGRG